MEEQPEDGIAENERVRDLDWTLLYTWFFTQHWKGRRAVLP